MNETKTVSSTSDERVVNNVMRHNYRVLSEAEKAQMQTLKDKGLEFIELLHQIGGTEKLFREAPSDAEVRHTSRYLSLAQTSVEEAVMWAVKHITR